MRRKPGAWATALTAPLTAARETFWGSGRLVVSPSSRAGTVTKLIIITRATTPMAIEKPSRPVLTTIVEAMACANPTPKPHVLR